MEFCVLVTTFDSEGEYSEFFVIRGPTVSAKSEVEAMDELGEGGWDFAGATSHARERRVYMKRPLRGELDIKYGSEEL